MAFGTSNVVRENAGSMNKLRGTWTGLDSDSVNGTITGTGYASAAFFMTNNSAGPENPVNARITNSGGTWTVSIPYTSTVTAGTFEVSFK